MAIRFWKKSSKKEDGKGSKETENLEYKIKEEAIPKIKEHFKQMSQFDREGTKHNINAHNEIKRIFQNIEMEPCRSDKDEEEGRFLYNIVNSYNNKDNFKFNGRVSIVELLLWTRLTWEYKMENLHNIKQEYDFLTTLFGKEFGKIYITNFPIMKPDSIKLPSDYNTAFKKFSELKQEEIEKENLIWTNFTAEQDEKELWGYISWMKIVKREENKDKETISGIVRVELSIKEEVKNYLTSH